jgi:hypothetical protein
MRLASSSPARISSLKLKQIAYFACAWRHEDGPHDEQPSGNSLSKIPACGILARNKRSHPHAAQRTAYDICWASKQVGPRRRDVRRMHPSLRPSACWTIIHDLVRFRRSPNESASSARIAFVSRSSEAVEALIQKKELFRSKPAEHAKWFQFTRPARLSSCCNWSCVRFNLAAATFSSR